MDKIRIGVLTVSDKIGLDLAQMIENGIVQNGIVTKMDLVPYRSEDVETKLSEWSKDGLDVILTTGGAADTETDMTPLTVLIRALSRVQEKCLIFSLPGSKTASQEILKAVAGLIPPAIDLITGRSKKVLESLTWKKSSVTDGKKKPTYSSMEVNEAQRITMNKLYLIRNETVLWYKKAFGHFLAEDVVIDYNVPPFDESLEDGYAVLSTDNTWERNVVEASMLGESAKVLPGNCLRVSKGAAVPPYADAVIPVKDTQMLECTNQNEEQKIKLRKLPRKGENIRQRGSEFKKGQLLLSSGTYLDSSAVGVLAAAGITSVKVYQKPSVAIISTGDELTNPEEDLKPGKVRDSNRIALISLLKEEDVQAEDLGIVPDEPDALLNALERAFRVADVVVTTGSMSMGERDYLKEVLVSDFNAEISFERVEMKPGTSTSLAFLVFEGKPKLCFYMSGNWDSVFVSSQLFLLPALRKISGNEKVFPLGVWAEIDVLRELDIFPKFLKVHLTYDNSSSRWTAILPGNETRCRPNGFIQLPSAYKVHEVQIRNMADNSISNWKFGNLLYMSFPLTLERPNFKFIVKAFLICKFLCAEMCEIIDWEY